MTCLASEYFRIDSAQQTSQILSAILLDFQSRGASCRMDAQRAVASGTMRARSSPHRTTDRSGAVGREEVVMFTRERVARGNASLNSDALASLHATRVGILALDWLDDQTLANRAG